MCPGYRRYLLSKKFETTTDFSRRKFISTMSAATAGILLSGFGKRNLLANSTDGQISTVAQANLSNYDRIMIRQTLEKMFTDLGGLSDIIPSSGKVAIKINLTGGVGGDLKTFCSNNNVTPGESYWTHPEILRAVGELVLDAGASELTIVEGIYDEASVSDYGLPDMSYREIIEDHLGATLLNTNYKEPYTGFAERTVGVNSLIYPTLNQNAIFDNIDCFISLAKSKQHKGGGTTHGMKNLVGTLPVGFYHNGNDNYRSAIHSIRNDADNNIYSNLRRVILDLNNATPINLVINDAIQTVLGSEGPWNNDLETVSFDTLIASKDPLAADTVATQVIGFDPMAEDDTDIFEDGINYFRKASELGMGNYDLNNNINIIDSTVTSISEQASIVPKSIKLSNYPNPFNIETVFEVSIPLGGYTSLIIYNTRGQIIRRLVSKSLTAGLNKVKWNGQNDQGRPVPSGMYLAKLSYDGQQKTHKVAVVK